MGGGTFGGVWGGGALPPRLPESGDRRDGETGGMGRVSSHLSFTTLKVNMFGMCN